MKPILQKIFPSPRTERKLSCRRFNYGWMLLCCTALSHFMLTRLYAPAQTEFWQDVDKPLSFDAPSEIAPRQSVGSTETKIELFGLSDENDNNPEATTQENYSTVELVTYPNKSCKGNGSKMKSSQPSPSSSIPQSVQIRGKGLVEVHVGTNQKWPHYRGTIMEVEGCVDLYELIADQPSVRFTLYTAENATIVPLARQQVSRPIQEEFSTTKDLSKPHTRFVFSAQSSDYFAYQVYANALGFLLSNQTNASWMRLLTAQQPDDLSDQFPTFTAPRSLYSNSYVPANKPDIIDKWFHSPDAPHPNDTIVVIDPDSKWMSTVLPFVCWLQQC